MDDCVLFDELEIGNHESGNGLRIGVITLNRERQLHALSRGMFPLMQAQLQAWQQLPDLICIVLQSTGDKAFCAGGDVKTMQQQLASDLSEDAKRTLLTDYFSAEYQLDHLLHRFTKPIIVWGDGIIMGGGLGLFMGASHRVVTETARIAMPEISIGLFPDVGATWFLNRLPQPGAGLFLGLTGAVINAKDADYLGLCTALLPRAQKNTLITELLQLPWSAQTDEHGEQINALLARLADDSVFPASNLEAHQPLLTALSQQGDLVSMLSLLEMQGGADPWLQNCCHKLQIGSPISAHVLYRQLTRYSELSLADCFRLELCLAVNIGLRGDFCEGVRALLIDKDNQPDWRYKKVEDVPESFIDALFC